MNIATFPFVMLGWNTFYTIYNIKRPVVKITYCKLRFYFKCCLKLCWVKLFTFDYLRTDLWKRVSIKIWGITQPMIMMVRTVFFWQLPLSQANKLSYEYSLLRINISNIRLLRKPQLLMAFKHCLSSPSLLDWCHCHCLSLFYNATSGAQNFC